MAETLADLHKLALRQESQLREAVEIASRLIIPPFTPKRRALIREGFGKPHLLFTGLNETWLRQLHQPENHSTPFYGAERVYFGNLRRRLTMWKETYVLLLQALDAPLLPVMPDRAPFGGDLDRLLYAYQGAFYRLHDQLSPPRPAPEDHVGKYNDIPLEFTLFARLMQLARRTALAVGRKAPMAFLDVGCGVGLKVLQASQYFEIAQGLEYDKTRVPVADNLMNDPRRPEDKAFQGDALEYHGYSGFDVIYAYKPLSLISLLIQMETRIITQAKPGTVLVLPYDEFEERYEGYGCGRVAQMVYVTGYGGRDMKPLLRKIAQIGFTVPEDPNLRAFDEGFVSPLTNTLRHWGYLA